MGAAAVATVAATAGVALAAGAGYGIYRLVEKKRDAHAKCPWCGRGPGRKKMKMAIKTRKRISNFNGKEG